MVMRATRNGDIMEQLCGKIGDADYQKKSVIVQGITGKFGSRHTKLMLEYGTNIVAGVTPGKGGTKFENDPFLSDAVKATGARISIVFVPACPILSFGQLPQYDA